MSDNQSNPSSSASYAYTHSEELPGSSPDFYSQADDLKTSFDQNRDPYIAAQLADAGKSEAERRREAVGQSELEQISRESFMIQRQQPKPVLRPSPALSMGVDRVTFNESLAADDRQAQQHIPVQEPYAPDTAQDAFNGNSVANDQSLDTERQNYINQRRETLSAGHEQSHSHEQDQHH